MNVSLYICNSVCLMALNCMLDARTTALQHTAQAQKSYSATQHTLFVCCCCCVYLLFSVCSSFALWISSTQKNDQHSTLAPAHASNV